jgi:hypothetical protein
MPGLLQGVRVPPLSQRGNSSRLRGDTSWPFEAPRCRTVPQRAGGLGSRTVPMGSTPRLLAPRLRARIRRGAEDQAKEVTRGH